MRSQEEIESQLWKCRDTLNAAREEGLDLVEDSMRNYIEALQWVLLIDRSKDIFY